MTFPQSLQGLQAMFAMTARHKANDGQHEPLAAEVSVEAILNFTNSSDRDSEWYIHNPAPGVIERTPDTDPRLVRIHNARVQYPGFVLDRAGFQILRKRTTMHDFSEENRVRSLYYAETADLVKRATGASDVLAFDYNIRSAEHRAENEILRQPSTSVHADYTENSAPRRVRQLLPATEAEQRLAKPFCFINVWRPLAHPVSDRPLALSDARTIKPGDFIRTTLRYRDRTGEIYTFRFNSAQRWYYYPLMQPDEVLLLKCYDSRRDGRARFVAHTSFIDPAGAPEAPPRRSVEVRTIAFFD